MKFVSDVDMFEYVVRRLGAIGRRGDLGLNNVEAKDVKIVNFNPIIPSAQMAKAIKFNEEIGYEAYYVIGVKDCFARLVCSDFDAQIEIYKNGSGDLGSVLTIEPEYGPQQKTSSGKPYRHNMWNEIMIANHGEDYREELIEFNKQYFEATIKAEYEKQLAKLKAENEAIVEIQLQK